MNQYIRNIGIALIIYILAVMYIVQGEALDGGGRFLIVFMGVVPVGVAFIITLNQQEDDK